MAGRRWSNGIHQAVEAKEGLPIKNDSKTLASISYQNLFLLYKQLSGMTGTAKTEEVEFEKIYNLEVVPIPTNKAIKRKDLSDLIYINQYVKWRCIAQECLEMFNLGRPVLIGTTTIEKSEVLASLLCECKLPYRLLNARPENAESESEIIAQAGCNKAITIATNMAGRGTDILLGGNSTFLVATAMKELFMKTKNLESNEFIQNLDIKDFNLLSDLTRQYPNLIKKPLSELKNQPSSVTALFVKLYELILREKKILVKKEGVRIKRFGGLHVIGTERHESRRIDNQLRGRAGRQGDPGSSRFFICLEDRLLRIFGGEQILSMMQTMNLSDDIPIQSGLLDRSLESAQKKVEALNYDTRKQLFKYEEPINTQRNGIYAERRRILEQQNLTDCIIDYAERSCNDLINKFPTIDDETSLKSIRSKFKNLVGVSFPNNFFLGKERLKYVSFLQQQIEIKYSLQDLEMEASGPELLNDIEKAFTLQEIDNAWAEHLQKISFLKESIKWVAYGQKDPVTEYKKEAFNYFNIMLTRIRHRVVYGILRLEILKYKSVG
jgi:preprotein translocase subunit SecA